MLNEQVSHRLDSAAFITLDARRLLKSLKDIVGLEHSLRALIYAAIKLSMLTFIWITKAVNI